MVSQPGSGPTRPKSPCYNNTLRQPPLRKSVKWTQSDKTQSDHDDDDLYNNNNNNIYYRG